MRPRHASFALAVLAAAASVRSAAAAPPEPGEQSQPARSGGERPPSPAEPDVTVALLSGVVTALVPIAIGGIHTAAAPVGNDAARNVGFAVAGVGPALSPIVAHVVLGEWARAAAFGAAPVASEIAICVFLKAEPDAVFHGTVGSRTTFGLLYSADILGATLGIIDVMMAPERARERARRGGARAFRDLTLAPMAGRGRAGVVLGGTL